MATFASVFRSLRKRLSTVEEKVGSNENPKTGLFLVLERLEEGLKKIKRDVDGWEDEPPEWLVTGVRRIIRNTSSVTLSNVHDMERLLEKVKRIEDRLDEFEKSCNRRYVDQGEYEHEARVRSEEIARIREQLGTTNGLLRGVTSALGYTDPEGDSLSRKLIIDDRERSQKYIIEENGPGPEGKKQR